MPRQTVRLYCSANVDTDLSVHIHTETDARNQHTSDLGIRLAAALRDHGMVQHTVWLADQNK